MEFLLPWVPPFWRELREPFEKVSWRGVCALASAGLVGQILWSHYGILRHKRLPFHDLGIPLLGHTWEIATKSLEVWGLAIMKGKQAVLAHYLFTHTVIVDHDLYMKHMHRAELDGKLCPLFPGHFRRIIGENSVINLPGGKGHTKHKRLRGKILSSLGPQYVLSIIPDILHIIRQNLDELVKETQSKGYAAFEDVAAHIATQGSVLPIAAGLEEAQQKRFEILMDEVLAGFLAVPINLGRFSQHGRGMRARGEVCAMISDLMASPNLHRKNIIADLMKDSEDGMGFSEDEISDSIFTLLLAGKATTADALPFLLVQLHQNKKWVAPIAAEGLEMKSPEEESVTLRVVKEALRMKPPAGAYRRVNDKEDVDLGDHGVIPKGCPIAIYLSPPLKQMGDAFEPDRWLSEDRNKFIVFGGRQPHECIGKHLALVELQLFARVLCREYDFDVLDATETVKASNPLNTSFKDGLRVKITKK